MFCYLSVDFNKNNTHKMIMILPNGPKVREKHLTIMYRSSVCVCGALTLHVDGKCDFLWIQFIPADLWSGDPLRH